MRSVIRLLAVFAALAGIARAQSIPTATLTGRVVDATEQVLPGATVTISSPGLQGKRAAVASGTGDYIFSLLPPGEYQVVVTMSGFPESRKTVQIASAASVRVDFTLQMGLTEQVTVVGEVPTDLIETPQVSTNYSSDLIDELPIGRTVTQTVLLAGGVADSGPSNAIRISGGPSYENLFLINGVVVNENLRGQPHDLFIEDAIQETTVMTGNISAEYGRFTGGVVNVITKSGGNELSGSYRASLTNDDWLATTPFNETKVDDLNWVHEATFGGPLLRDRIWFFGAGRKATTSTARETRPTLRAGDIDPVPIPYVNERDTRRLEGKITAALNSDHRFVASVIDIADEEVNNAFNQNILDTASLITRQTPNRLMAFNYTGVLSPRLFVEAQYSRKDFTFENSGSPFRDLLKGTLLIDQSRGGARFNSPTFANDTPEQRDSHSIAVKGTYFLPTQSRGTHDIRFGYERFAESRFANNYQSGSDYRIFANGALVRGTDIFPVFTTGTIIQYNPISERTQGSDLKMHSVFLNDKVTLGRHWTINLGLRFDKNNSKDSRGTLVANDSGFSPRFSANFDVKGDGKLTFTAGYGKYVAKIAETAAGLGSAAGLAAEYRWLYQGPSINADPNAPTSALVPTDQAITRLFDWFNTNGGTNRRPFERAPGIPGLSERINGTLSSPNVKEYAFGIGLGLGSRGLLRADLIHRNWDDFYESRIDTITGKTPVNELGQQFDLALVQNSNYFERKYLGLQTQFRFRITKDIEGGGNYTWSRLTGNHSGETVNNGPVTRQGRGYFAPMVDDTFTQYPEYREESWNNPYGVLPGDQPHRARLWVGYNVETAIGRLNITALQHFDSGLPYEAVAVIDSSPYVTNPGYLNPPTSKNYFFTAPGEFRTDDILRTDIALNYSLRRFGKMELFAQPELLNVFNQSGVVLGRGDANGVQPTLGIDTVVNTRKQQTGFLPFNPFTETPVQAARDTASPRGHYDLSPTFGRPTSKSGYQLPRTFRVSFGVRF